MKYILILHLCSIITQQCPESQITGLMFKSHYDCAVGGYAVALNSFKMLKEDDYYGLDRVNNERIAIKFECKEMPTT